MVYPLSAFANLPSVLVENVLLSTQTMLADALPRHVKQLLVLMVNASTLTERMVLTVEEIRERVESIIIVKLNFVTMEENVNYGLMPIIHLAQEQQQEFVEASIALVVNVALVLIYRKIALTAHLLIPLLCLNVTLSNVKTMLAANPLQMILYLVPEQETQELACNGDAETVLV